MSATASCKFPYLDEWKRYCDNNRICAFLDSVLSGYAQLAFNDNSFSGLLMIIATWIGSPVLCMNALWGTVVATFFAYMIGLPEGAIRAGIYGANAALSCLAVPVLLFSSSRISAAMLGVSAVIAVFTVLLVKFLGKPFTRWNLPSLVVPYCIVLSISLWILTITGASSIAPLTIDTLLFTNPVSNWTAKEFLTAFFNCASEILWLVKPLSGILYLIALSFASRLDTLNTLVAILVSTIVSALLGLPKDAVITGLYGYNAILLTQVLTRSFLLNKRSYLLTFIMAAFSPVLCLVYQLLLPHLGIGSFLALPYLTLVYIVLINRHYLKGFTYIPVKYWGVPETIAKNHIK